MSNNVDPNWLLVPMEVSALAVGATGAGQDATPPIYWGDLTPDYTQIWSHAKLLGPDLVTPVPPGEPSNAPPAGIHLHWILPAAFGRTSASGESAAGGYPIIPNRWLVRRVRYKKDSADIVEVQAWVVESDYLDQVTGPDPVTNTVSPLPGTVAVPQIGSTDFPYLCGSLGRSVPLPWAETTHARFSPLTVLGPGTVEFAAHYPSCKSVLGFHDPQPDGGNPGDWQVSYFVAGWYSDPTADVLNGVTGDSWGGKLKELQWTLLDPPSPPPAQPVSPPPPEPVPDSFPVLTLCHGAVSRIAWNNSVLHQPPAALTATPVTVCVGNTSAEALATILARQMQSDGWHPDAAPQPPSGGNDSSSSEKLLAAFQYSMLASAAYLGDLEAELHRHRFTSKSGGDLYTIDAKQSSVTPGAAAPSGMVEQPALVQFLPDDVAGGLDDLNQKAAAAARLARELGSLQQTFFSTWSAWAIAYTNNFKEPQNSGSLMNAIQAAGTAVNSKISDAQAAQNLHTQARDALVADLAARLPNLELSVSIHPPINPSTNSPSITRAKSTEPPFYRPTDPFLVLAGDGLGPVNVFLTDLSAQSLRCRQVQEIVTGLRATLSVGMGTLPVVQLFGSVLHQYSISSSFSSGVGPPGSLLDQLLEELLLLDPLQAPVVTNQLSGSLSPDESSALSDATESLLAGAGVSATENGVTVSLTSDNGSPKLPAPMALSRWTANPWRPLFLVWGVNWYPDPSLYSSGKDLPANWSGWPLPSGGPGMPAVPGNEWQPATLAPPAAFPADPTYQSYSLLGGHPERVLQRRLEALVSQNANEKINELISDLEHLQIVAQSLGGFHDRLRQLRHGLQLPPVNPAYVCQSTTPPDSSIPKLDPLAIPPNVPPLDPTQMHAPHFDADFQPIRAGQLQISRLWLVDSFGQVRQLIDPTPNGPTCDVITSFGLPAPAPAANSPTLIPLPPRFVQPARLDFRWISANDDQPGGSPLCGWIFPNHLDQSLMLCDASGKLWGALQTIIRTTLAGGTGAAPDPNDKAFFWVSVPGSDTTPTDLPDPHLRAFASYILQLGADAGTAFLTTIADAQNDTGAAPEHDPRLSVLIGRPLALARASVQIELMGLPVQQAPPLPDGSTSPLPDPTRGFTQVNFPLWLGGPPEVPGASGGLAGYFVGDGSDFCDRTNQLPVNAAQPLVLTLLLDPSAPVYARCPLLPCSSFRLPEAVGASLSRILDVFFQSAPLLGPPGGPRIPRPSDDYGQWSWAVRPRVTYWQEYAEIADPGDRAGFGQGPLELQEGWLKLAMNPVHIDAFWVKQGAATVAAGTTITLGWMVEGAESLTLSVGGTTPPLQSWTQQPGFDLPTEHQLQVSAKQQITLTATDGQGNRSTKSLQLNIT